MAIQEVCRNYANGRCWRMNKPKGCPYKHDEALHSQAQDQKMKASRFKLQANYTKSSAALDATKINSNNPAPADASALKSETDAPVNIIATNLEKLPSLKKGKKRPKKSATVGNKNTPNPESPAAAEKTPPASEPQPPIETNIAPKPVKSAHPTPEFTAPLKKDKPKFCQDYVYSECTRVDCKFQHDEDCRSQHLDRMKAEIDKYLPSNCSSNQLCYFFCSGGFCHRFFKDLRCPYYHDFEIRSAVLDREMYKPVPPTYFVVQTSTCLTGSDSGPGSKRSFSTRSKSPAHSGPHTSLRKVPRLMQGNLVQSWDKLDDNSWKAWAEKNLEGSAATKYQQYIDNGDFDNGCFPPGFLFDLDKPTSPKNFTIFTKFPELPIELRELVWKFAAINESSFDCRVQIRSEEINNKIVNTKFTLQSDTPRLLHICHESREVAIRTRTYRKAFGTIYSSSKIWFNFNKDRLFLHTRLPEELPLMVREMAEIHRHHVRHIAMPLRDWIISNDKPLLTALTKFPNLKRLDIVYGDGKEDREATREKPPKYYQRGAQVCLIVYWRRHFKNRPPPQVHLDEIDAVRARIFEIDRLVY